MRLLTKSLRSAFFLSSFLLETHLSFLPINVTSFFISVETEYWPLDMTERQSVIYVSKV